MQSQLVAQFMPFFRLIARILMFRDKKVPYFNVSRQNRVIFDWFATKQCWGMLKMWGQPLFCNQPSKCTTATYLLLCISFMNNSQTKSSGYNKMQRRLIVIVALWFSLAPSGSLWLAVRLSLARCPALSGSLSGSLWLILALSGSLWLPLALCPALSGSIWLSQALSGSLRLSMALRICLQSPCLAHKALAQLVAALPRYSTFFSPVL